MPPTLATRKPIDRLTGEDLDTFPIWEFAVDETGDEQEETCVRPRQALAIEMGLHSLSVAADFVTASGQPHRGFVEVHTVKDVEFGHGALIVGQDYIFLPGLSYQEAGPVKKAAASVLGLPLSKLFPLQFKLRVPVGEERFLRSGVLI